MNKLSYRYLKWCCSTLMVFLLLFQFSLLNGQCPNGSIQFYSQADVNDFPINYPNCTQIIDYQVYISGSDITDLSPLSQLTYIHNLSIDNCPLLTSLNGLHNLTTIKETLNITDTPIQNVNELSSVTLMDGDLNEPFIYFQNCEVLTDLSGLSNITGFDGFLQLSSNDLLSNLNGVGHFTNLAGLTINQNLVSDLSVFSNLTSVGYLEIKNNNHITSLSGLHNLSNIDHLQLFQVSSLSDMFAIQHITSYSGDVFIQKTGRSDVSYLQNCTSIGGELRISVDNNINDLSGLSSLVSVGGNLLIWYLNNVTSLSGLQNLNTVGGELRIANNNSLTDISSISGLDYASISDLNLSNNPNLSSCSFLPICTYINLPGAIYNISNNAVGCNSDIEVLASCPTISGCTDPSAHNYDAAATQDDGSCETCSDGVMNGDETGIDCGGVLCGACAIPFITTWKTDNPGTSNSTSITIPTRVGTYNYDVDWENDGTYDDFGVTGNITHNYNSGGVYQVAIKGNFPSIFFNNEGDREKILSIDQWGDIMWSSMQNAFYGCTNLQGLASDSPNLQYVINLQAMFSNTAVFNQDISSWDVSNIANMLAMFDDATAFNQDISSWDVSNVQNMQSMFFGASSFNQDLSAWNVGNVLTMRNMFRDALAFDQDLAAWDMTNVGNLEFILSNSNLSITNYDATLTGWSTQNVQANLNLGANGLQYCYAGPARDDLINNHGWTITDSGQDPACAAVLGCIDPTAHNYDSAATQDDGSCQTCSDGVMNGDETGIDCGGALCGACAIPFITTWKTDNPGTSNSKSITIPTNSSYTYSYDIDWENDGIYDDFGVTGNITHDYGTAGTYQVAIKGSFPTIYFFSSGEQDKLISIDQWGDNPWQTFYRSFWGCSNMNGLSSDAPDLQNVSNLRAMFFSCSSFNQDIGNWDVSGITQFAQMFAGCTIFNQDISSWDVSSGTLFLIMFSQASSFNQDISSWDVSSASSMSSMFSGASSFNQDISSWDVSNVSQMNSMFSNASSFNQDISTWNVGNVSLMQQMFNNASSFDQDISTWNITNVSDLTSTFNFAGFSTLNYDNILIGWSNQNVQANLSLGASGLLYCNAGPARDDLINNHGWTISDAGQDPACATILGCTDPTAHNYDSAATQDDGSCQTCSDAVMNGDETGVDCGGTICSPCMVTPLSITSFQNGDILDNGCSNAGRFNESIAFPLAWTPVVGATSYNVVLTNTWASIPLLNINLSGTSYSYSCNGCFTFSTSVELKVRALVNGVWSNFSPTVVATYEPVNTDCPEGCTDATAHNYDPLATVDNNSCQTCSDGIMNGDETGVDCGGVLCGPCAIPNDNICNAETIACGDTKTGSTANATLDNPLSTDCGSGGATANNVWYSFVGNGYQVTLSLCGSGYDTRIDVYCLTSGSCVTGNYTCAAGNDDNCGLQSEVTISTQTGTSYYVSVHGFSFSTGSYTLAMTCTAAMAPANNDCDGTGGGCRSYGIAEAVSVSSGPCQSYTFVDNLFADIAQNNDSGLISCQPNFSTVYDSWYEITPSASTDVNIDIVKGAIGTLGMSIYDNCSGASVYCDGNVNGLETISGLTAGNTYYIQFWTTAINKGDFTFCVYQDVSGCTDATAHNFDPLANIDDGSCETCSDGILNGDESNIDCGGALCSPCPCIVGDDFYITSPNLASSSVSAGSSISAHCLQNYCGPSTSTLYPIMGYFLSLDSSYDPGLDVLLTTDLSTLKVSDTNDPESANLSISAGVLPGNYYILFVSEYQDLLLETDETNNVVSLPITITAPSFMDDFFITNTTAPAAAGVGDNITLTCRQNYAGTSATTLSVIMGYYLSSDINFDASDIKLGVDYSTLHSGDLFDPENATVQIPSGTVSGNYYILYVADEPDAFTEADETNNVESLPISISPNTTPIVEDVYLTNANVGLTAINPGGTTTLSCFQNYLGNGGNYSVKLRYYLSVDQTPDTGDVVLGDDTSTIGINDANDSENILATIPTSTAPGNYYIVFHSDWLDAVSPETNDANNLVAIPITVTGTPSTISIVTNELVKGINSLPVIKIKEHVLTRQLEDENSFYIEHDIKAFPNPSTGMIRFTGVSELGNEVKLSIIDSYGRQIDLINSINSIDQINIGEHPNGIYQFIFETEEKLLKTQRVILIK